MHTLSEHDASTQHQREALAQSRRVATLLLLCMVGVYAWCRLSAHTPTTSAPYPWLGYVEAFAEAAMIGALADWFAVVALFRHPLGLPIPHTAIIPRSKARIAESLADFVTLNFIAPHRAGSPQHSFDLVLPLTDWLSLEANRLALARYVLRGVPAISKNLSESPLSPLLQSWLQSATRSVRIGPFAGDLIDLLLSSPHQHRVITELIQLFAAAIENNRSLLEERVSAAAPWFLPEFVTSPLAQRLVSRLAALLREMEEGPSHPARAAIHKSLREFAERLRSDHAYADRATDVLSDILSSPHLQSYLEDILKGFHQQVSREFADPPQALLDWASKLIDSIRQKLLDNPALREQLNTLIQEVSHSLLASHTRGLRQKIQDTIEGWDTRTVIEKLELQVGRDLQFIRINGTLVGGVVGLLLYLLKTL